ncbi:MAG: transketolase [Candidatus Peregrinibacteria bacterium GW2011_GWF2_39_17]|nr:MAG: transketolase [Candidatus Peregrinibacteria bacterium GW2011_GWF2_39_17]HCW32653.1 hypothetical protein [Candidatus Peregrinibacteria bacterium]
MKLDELVYLAHDFRLQLLKMFHESGIGNTGISLAYIDLLTVMYFGTDNSRLLLNYDALKPQWEERDRIILSCPEAIAAQYVCLAKAGFFAESQLNNFGKFGALLQAEPTLEVPGIDAVFKTSGEGLKAGVDLALGIGDSKKSRRVFVILGDEDLLQGATWEAAMEASFERLSSLVAISVHTGLRKVEPIVDKFEAFGWSVLSLVDGHNYEEIKQALLRAKVVSRRPVFIFAPAVLGKGVFFAEHKEHYAKAVFSDHEYEEAIRNFES